MNKLKEIPTVALIVLLTIAFIPAHAADEDPVKSLELKLEGACDSVNSKLWLISNHPSKVIMATLRWNLAGSKRVVSDQFQVNPSSRVEIGCAAQADIVTAQFVK